MRTTLKIATMAAALGLAPLTAQASKVGGAGGGAVVAKPVGAGVVGPKVAPNPNQSKPHFTCSRDDKGNRHCRRS